MPNKTILPPPYLTLEDLNGAVITGGTVTFLETGTAILAVVYADADGLVISANPLTVDGAGRYTVFLTPGQVVDAEYRDASGTLIKTVPAVQAIPSASGNVDVSGTSGEPVTAGQVVYLSDGSGGKTAGRWFLANATVAYASSLPIIGMTTTAGSAGTTVTVRTAGRVTDLAGLTVGAPYYVSNTAGALSLTPGALARLVGQADSTTSLVLFANPPDPSKNSIIISTTGVVAQLDPQGAQTIAFLNASLLTIQGMKPGYAGQRVQLIAYTGRVDLLGNSVAVPLSDQLYNFVRSGPTSLNPDGSGMAPTAVYEFNSNAWRLVAHEQGGWITPAFSAADYAGTGGMTWTVASGNVARCGYRLSGRTLFVQFGVGNTIIGGVASSGLVRAMPGGYTAANTSIAPCLSADAGGILPNAYWSANAAQLVFQASLPAVPTNWTLGPGCQVYFDGTIEVS